MSEGIIEILPVVNLQEKSKRFDEINAQFMGKYFDLVWFARSDEKKLLKGEHYEALEKLKEITSKYEEEVEGLYSEDSNWHHGFNSGILAYSRFLSSYLEDTLWPIDPDDEQPDESEIVIVDGNKYVKIDGKAEAIEEFPFLDT
jgi:hypothetical protein